jgi:uncharacterized protein
MEWVVTGKNCLFGLLVACGCGAPQLPGWGNSQQFAGGPVEQSAPPPSCGGAPTEQNPFIIDWPADARAALTSLASRQLAVVRLDCQSFQVLWDCRLPGAYAYQGYSPKQEVRHLQSAEDLRVNLPTSAQSPASLLPREIGRGNSVDLTIRMVGSYQAERPGARFAELAGNCAGATHFVRAVTVGASLLSAGGGATYAADGDFNACGAATHDAAAPPAACAAPLQLGLVPLQ